MKKQIPATETAKLTALAQKLSFQSTDQLQEITAALEAAFLMGVGAVSMLEPGIQPGDHVTFMKNGQRVTGVFQSMAGDGVAVILRKHCTSEVPLCALSLKARLVTLN